MLFADNFLSCCLLFFGTGVSFYFTAKRSYDTFAKVQPEIIAVGIGIFGINLRSVFNVFSPFYFYTLYPVDPFEIDEEFQDVKVCRIVPLHEKVCRVISMAGLVFAIYESHGYRKTGIFVVSTLIYVEIQHYLNESLYRQSRNTTFHVAWMFAGGYFGYLKRNYYCALSYIPYGISFFGMEPEDDMAWSTMRIINNYCMLAHVFLILEAIREARSIDL